jgi:hypothetical protein
LCGVKHDVFLGARIPRQCLLVEAIDEAIINDRETGQFDNNRSAIFRSKILNHFIKGKIVLSPLETILVIPRELESFESLVKLAKKKCDEGLKTINLTKVERSHVIQRFNIHKNHHNKTIYLLIEINNNFIERLNVDTSALMLVMSISIVRRLGLMHLACGSEVYKTTSKVVTQALGMITKFLVKVRDV